MLTDRRFGRRRENRFRELFTFLEPFRQTDTADGAVFFVAFPAGTCDVSANNAFYRNHLQLLGFHAVSIKFGFSEKHRHIRCVNRNHMVRYHVFCKIKPKLGHLIQYFTFFRNRTFQNIIECGNAVSANHDKAVAQIIQFTNLPRFKRLIFFHHTLPVTYIIISIRSVTFHLYDKFQQPFLHDILYIFYKDLYLLPRRFPLPGTPHF